MGPSVHTCNAVMCSHGLQWDVMLITQRAVGDGEHDGGYWALTATGLRASPARWPLEGGKGVMRGCVCVCVMCAMEWWTLYLPAKGGGDEGQTDFLLSCMIIPPHLPLPQPSITFSLSLREVVIEEKWGGEWSKTTKMYGVTWKKEEKWGEGDK